MYLLLDGGMQLLLDGTATLEVWQTVWWHIHGLCTLWLVHIKAKRAEAGGNELIMATKHIGDDGSSSTYDP